MRIILQKAVVAGIILATCATVHATILYDDSTTDTGNTLNFVNGQTIGNEVKLGAGINAASLTNFSFEIYSTLATFTGVNVQMEVYLYANDGTPFNGYPTPSTSLYDSGLFALQTPQQYQGMNAVTLDFDLSATPVNIPNDFTLAVVVTGLAGGDTVGIELFDPATTGQNFGDYWFNNGGGWQLLTNTVPTDFGAQFLGTVPEPSSVRLGVAGAALLAGLTWFGRRQNASKKNPSL